MEKQGQKRSDVRAAQNKRVAVMTWYHYRNYGTALQAVALCYIISNLGYEPYLIQYKPRGNVLKKITFGQFCNKSYNWILNHIHRPKFYHTEQKEKFFREFFEKRVKQTEVVDSDNDFAQLNSKFDTFVCGSDQIWSPLGFDDKYNLSFVVDSDKKIAYAPSMGVSKIDDKETREKITELLIDFKFISIRERQGSKMIKELTGQDAKVVLDPTLLISSSEWDDFAKISYTQKIKQPYILCYYLGQPSRYRDYVKAAAEKWGLPVFEIPTVRDHGRYADFPFEVGPSEFVSLIKNASFVFTDSFHGMVFSIIYKIPFIVFERFEKDDPKNQNSRIYSLVELLGLEKRLMHPDDICRIDGISQFDFSECYKKLDKLRKESLDYLQNSLYESIKHN